MINEPRNAALLRPQGFARDTIVVTACTLLSRLTGFVRVLVAAAVLSNGLLGDTYHAANTIPNLLFELVAGGVLQAFLVPSFVAARRSGGDEELGRSAGVVLGVLLVALSAVAALMMALSPLITHVLTSAGTDAAVIADERAVMTPMLLVFIPQIVFYGMGMVTTAALAARGRFAAAALAPAVNNIVVITCYLLYRASRQGQEASLDLDSTQFLLVAGGTTLAVIAFTAVPGIVLRSQGVRWRPRWRPHDRLVGDLRASVGWAMLSIVGTLVPTAAAIVLGYRVEGGVAVFTMTFAFFVLPHALIAVPVATTSAPRIADAWQRGDRERTGALIERSARVIVPLLSLAGAAMVALSWPVARVASSFGQAASQGVAPIAHALAMFGLGLLGYGMSFTMTRVLFSLSDVKRASLLVAAAAILGVFAMTIASVVMADSDRAAALALGYGTTQTLSAALLTWRAHQVTGYPTRRSIGQLGVGSLAAAVAAGVVMFGVQQWFDVSRSASLAAIVGAGTVGLVVFVVCVSLFAGVRPQALLGKAAGGG
ncbi:MAG: lipid II flippase MurJ [Actinomycetota bacterium]